MRRSDALAQLRPLEPTLRRQGLSALYLFGSVARDEATGASDVDLLFDVADEAKFSLFDQARIQVELAAELQVAVDLISVEGLRPDMRDRIAASLIQIF